MGDYHSHRDGDSGIHDSWVLPSCQRSCFFPGRINERPRFLVIGTDGQKPDSRGRSVRVGRTTRIISVMRAVVLIWGAWARKIDDQEAPAMTIQRVVDVVPEKSLKLFPSSPGSIGMGSMVRENVGCGRLASSVAERIIPFEENEKMS